jgi:hypothetical protein
MEIHFRASECWAIASAILSKAVSLVLFLLPWVLSQRLRRLFILWGGGALERPGPRPHNENVTSYGDPFSRVWMLGDSQRDSEQNCLFGFVPAAWLLSHRLGSSSFSGEAVLLYAWPKTVSFDL